MTKKKILVVDDEPAIVKAIYVRLKNADFDVIIAYDPIQALSLAHNENPDLILLDIKMPVGGGIGLYKNLQRSANLAMIPVIFITANVNEETRGQILEMGAADFIAKPFETEELLSKVRRALG